MSAGKVDGRGKSTMGGILGVNIAAGVAYLGLLRIGTSTVENHCPKLALSSGTNEWEALRNFGERFVAEATAHRVTDVIFVDPRRYGNWSYSDARVRVALHVAAGLALQAAQITSTSISQRTIAKQLGFSGLKKMDEGLEAKLSIDVRTITHWKQRSVAFAAALTRSIGTETV